jgi:hypothetical protein
VGPRTVLAEVVKRKIPSPCQESNPGRPSLSLVTVMTEPSRLLVYKLTFLYTVWLVLP